MNVEIILLAVALMIGSLAFAKVETRTMPDDEPPGSRRE